MFLRKVIFQSTLFGALAGLLVLPLSLLYPFLNVLTDYDIPEATVGIWMSDLIGSVVFAPFFSIAGALCGLVFGIIYGVGLVRLERRSTKRGGELLKEINEALLLIFGVTVLMVIAYSMFFLAPTPDRLNIPIRFIWVCWTPLLTLIFLNQKLLNDLRRPY